MNNLLRQISNDDIVIRTNVRYNRDVLTRCEAIFKKAVRENQLHGSFKDDIWEGYTGIRKTLITFRFDEKEYQTHIGELFEISALTMKKMLKCYAIYCYGVYILNTIDDNKIGTIKLFLERYGEIGYTATKAEIATIEDFLEFIDTPRAQIDDIVGAIKIKKEKTSRQRQLSPIVNYLVIAQEINRLFGSNIDEDTFRRWFPVFFWVNVTLVLPLRATEMLVTPKECIRRDNDGVYLKIRRTNLKKGKRTVYYDVDRDYTVYEYKLPNFDVVKKIEDYISMTREQERRFLFETKPWMINGMVSLAAFNRMLKEFMKEHIVGNKRYEYAKYASGISEFEFVTAGDSRPIAMSNLYFQGAGEDICRQLADHENISTSAGYYTNITETIWATSIMEYQARINSDSFNLQREIEIAKSNAVEINGSVCLSEKRNLDKSNIEDCEREKHLSDCLGCKYYFLSKNELDTFIKKQKKRADDSAKKVREFINDTSKIKGEDISIDDLFLSVQTEATRYRIGCDIRAREVGKEWLRSKNMMKRSF